MTVRWTVRAAEPTEQGCARGETITRSASRPTEWNTSFKNPTFVLVDKCGIFVGAGDEARTRYLHLGKVALYRMSYTRKWCLRPELNWRHADFQSAALPTELPRHIEASIKLASTSLLATLNRLELSTSSVTGWRANRLHHRAKYLGGKYRARTCDPLLVRQVLSQLS